jgi:lysophospholipase L1-like esterase
MVAAFRKINPTIRIYVARPIPSGKLPKYSYLAPLGDALAQMAKRLHTEKQPVILVDHATGFDARNDTIADLVHPNASGAEKMAQRWFDALKPVVKP